MLNDFHYAFRALRRSPGFTVIAVLSLGLGIGATTTIYSVIDALDFRPLPYRDADRLVTLRELTPPNFPGCGRCPWGAHFSAVAEWRQRSHSYDDIALHTRGSFDWIRGDTLEELNVAEVSSGFLPLLGVRPQVGRSFEPADTVAGAERVTLLSDEFWRSRFGADSHVLGKTLPLYDNLAQRPELIRVIGVLPKGFQFAEPHGFTVPLQHGTFEQDGGGEVIARLRNGVTLAGAITELRTIDGRLAPTRPAARREWSATVLPLRRLFVSNDPGSGRFVLFGIVLFVLAIAVANVAGLALARATTRRHELTVRSALGTPSAALVTHLLSEGACIGLASAALGILLAIEGVQLARVWFRTGSTGLVPTVDLRLLAFTVALSLIAGMATAVLPARMAIRTDLHDALQERGGGGSGARGGWAGGALVVGLIASALVLVTGAGLLTADLLHVKYHEVAFDPRGLYDIMPPMLTTQRADPAQAQLLGIEIRDRVGALGGVSATHVVLGSYYNARQVHVDRGTEHLESVINDLAMLMVDPAYFSGMGIRLVAGRGFTPGDVPGGRSVAVIDEATAAIFWPGQSALGRQVLVKDRDSSGTWLTIVGVAATAKGLDAGFKGPTDVALIYRPFEQTPLNGDNIFLNLYIRVPARPNRVLASVMESIREITHHAVAPPRSMSDDLAGQFQSARLNALTLNGFALFAVLLAAMGVYGIVAYGVTQRTREIGVYIALGAPRMDVLALIMRRALIFAAAGVVIGVVSWLALGNVLRSLVYGTSVMDPPLIGACALLLIAITLVATYVPARRAATIDPAQAMRGSL